MRILFFVLSIIVLMMPVYAAKYAGEPFSLGVGGRALALGGAAVAGPFDASAGYWNPAGLHYLPGRNLMAMHAETFGSLLNHDFVAFTSYKDTSSVFRSYGFYLYYLGGGGIKITEQDPVTERPYVLREESHGDYLFAGTVSGKIKNKIDFGLTAKLIYRDVATFSGYGLTLDAGLLYQMRKYLRIGLAVTDITSGFIRYSNKTTESILPTVRPAFLLSHRAYDFGGKLAFTGDVKFEGRKEAAEYWMGELSLDTHWGIELDYKEIVFGRVGSDIGSFTTGLGVSVNRVTVDLAYLHNSFFDETFRVSAGYSF